MKMILNAEQMQQCDANTMESGYGVPSAVLMERAALSVVDEITSAYPDPSTRVLLACGTGNNGGDGLAAARLLYLKDYKVTVLFPGDEKKCSTEASRQLETDRRYGIEIIREFPKDDMAGQDPGSDTVGQDPESDKAGQHPGSRYDVIVDAIFGIGLSREIGGSYREIIDRLNTESGLKVAVDIPSGVNADTGKVMGTAFNADLTVTFGFAKIGQLLYPGAGICGKLVVKDIGIDERSLFDIKPAFKMAEPKDMSLLPERTDDSNKGTYGRVLIFAGSYNMAGAAALSARAAYRTGAGLVCVVTDSANREIIQTLVPEAILATYDAKTDMASFVHEQIGWADSAVLGPGIGRSRQAEEMVRAVLAEALCTCVVDADAINILSDHPDWLSSRTDRRILTPHPGEMARLMHMNSAAEVKEDLTKAISDCRRTFGCVTVLKDVRTLVAYEDEMWINTTGNNGMATAGSGDVLSGIIGALAAQKTQPLMSAVLGVMIHGMAGDAAAERIGKASLMASDIIDGLCELS